MRWTILRAVGIVGLLCAAVGAADKKDPGRKPPARTNSSVQVTLKQQLEKGLKCRRPLEFEFVDKVVRKVEAGELDINTVNIAFAWSRKRNSFRPYVYFERAVRELAKRDGVDIDAVTKTAKTTEKRRFSLLPSSFMKPKAR